ncbi:GNAT family N-acetyltransferase [Bauldia sp.]|uniref:GNAT family N-acetyltransferase n=1 Tax=Bauldia sp. TaxID=2575872 RepID=UPI003BACDF5C
MSDWTIRRAGLADADPLTACLEVAYAEDAARLADLPSMSDGVAGQIANDQVWVAEADGTVVGGLVLATGDGFMQLVNVAVHPDRRGTGLGRALLQLADREAVAQGFAEMRLNTHAGMDANVGLYTRLGWIETDRQRNVVAMRKPLTDAAPDQTGASRSRPGPREARLAAALRANLRRRKAATTKRGDSDG